MYNLMQEQVLLVLNFLLFYIFVYFVLIKLTLTYELLCHIIFIKIEQTVHITGVFMDDTKTLSELTAEISENLLNAMIFSEILKDIIDGETKEDILISNIFNNIKNAFNNIEICRKTISNYD